MKERFDAVIGINLKGAFNMIRHCTPFIRARSGTIINIKYSYPYGNRVRLTTGLQRLIGLTKSVARSLHPVA